MKTVAQTVIEADRFYTIAAKGGNVHLVGDCDTVGNLRTVIWQAYETAMKL